MAKLNLSFYNGETEYSDGTLEDELLELFEKKESKEEFLRNDDRWASLYHLSDFRQNILSWYPFKKNAALLEVGAGCGALTGLFCDRVESVTSIELTERRSKVNYTRNKHFDNLEIISGNFHNIRFNDKFDYIVLNGVLEYAASFTDTDNPYEDFLKELKRLLKPNGVILIAIENRLGMKYLNGAPEDHTNKLFSGINNYSDVDYVRTFTKGELKEVISDAGFRSMRFFYPAPDYKFPTSIFTDDSVQMADHSLFDYSFNANRLQFFNELSFADCLKSEKLLPSFFNSFLVEVSEELEERESNRIEYVKLPLIRKKRFCLETLILDQNGEKSVIKKALYKEGQLHLQKMLLFYEKNPTYCGYITAPAKLCSEGVNFDFIKGINMMDYLNEMLQKDKTDEFEKELLNFSRALYKNSFQSDSYQTHDFCDVFGDTKTDKAYHCHNISNIDMIFPNIIIQESSRYLIDYEWVFDFPVPIDFIIWRTLFMAYNQNNIFREKYTFEELIKFVGIDEQDSEIFYSWHENFSNRYVSNNTVRKYFGTHIDTDLLLNNQLNAYNQNSTLYFDYGNGFREEDSLTVPVTIRGNKYEVEFDFSLMRKAHNGQNPNELRWDPCECPAILSNIVLETENDLELLCVNALKDGDSYYFYTNDPQFIVKGDYARFKKLKIYCTYEARIEQIFENVETQFSDRINHLLKRKSEAEKEVKRLTANIKELEDTLTVITKSNSWKATAGLRKYVDKVKILKNKLGGK